MTREAEFYRRLKILQKLSKKSINEIERELGYHRNTLHNYKRGNEPSGKKLLELSHYFGVSPEYLLGEEDVSNLLSVQTMFYSLNNKQKKELYLLCQEWLLSITLN